MPYKRTADRVQHQVQQLRDFAGIRDPHIGKATKRSHTKSQRKSSKKGRRY